METETKKMQKTRRAVVTSKRGDKSITVQIDYLVKHPKYGKYIRRRTKLGVHDPKNQAGVGDIVDIAECRPVSKMISWRLVNIVKKAVIE
ncbi:MAG TPA: 30S ribosomal protein S17 [Phycisphaerales bacterium]|nr:30S ribosomal protein S17 [Phycisphaerales bacterium]